MIRGSSCTVSLLNVHMNRLLFCSSANINQIPKIPHKDPIENLIKHQYKINHEYRNVKLLVDDIVGNGDYPQIIFQ